MIHGVVTMIIKEGAMPAFRELAAELAPVVRREKGCLGYEYTVDVEPPLPRQEPVNGNRVTLIETWASLEALAAHSAAPHMQAAVQKLNALRESVTIRMTRPL